MSDSQQMRAIDEANAAIADPYIAHATRLGIRTMDPVQSAKAAKRASPANAPCPRCKFSVDGCADCSWTGVVPRGQTHFHRWSSIKFRGPGVCLHSQTCLDCGETRETDSSD